VALDDVPLGDQLLAADAVATIERLLYLDDLWTSHLLRFGRERLPNGRLALDIVGLRGLHRDVLWLLGEAAEKCRALDRIVGDREEELNKALQDAAAAQGSGELDSLGRALAAEADFAGLFREAARYIDQATPEEIVKLAEEMRNIAAGRYEPGSLSRNMKCALLIAAAVGAAVIFAGTDGGTVAGVLAGPVQVACQEVWERLRHRTRGDMV
jgi:hypothetical protein